MPNGPGKHQRLNAGQSEHRPQGHVIGAPATCGASGAARRGAALGRTTSKPRHQLAPLRTSSHRGALPGREVRRTLERLLGVFAAGAVLRDVVLPYLREVGERWACGEATIAQEHFASNFLEGWMQTMARGWNRSGPY